MVEMNGGVIIKNINEDIMVQVLRAEAMEIRDIDSGEKPFLYASGNWGPGYISIKNLVGRKKIMRSLTLLLAFQIASKWPYLKAIAGNVTGGMIPGWLLSEYLETLLCREVPFVYVRGMRKKGGQKELITGLSNKPELSEADSILVVEELMNFAETTCNSAEALRGMGYSVTHSACILFYANPEAVKRLAEAHIKVIYLFTLPHLLVVAEKYATHPFKLIVDFREYLRNPLKWQEERNLKPIKEGGTQ